MSKFLKFTPIETGVTPLSDDHLITQAHFKCEKCGADLVYSPQTKGLLCLHCGHQYPVPISPQAIDEYDFDKAVHQLDHLRHKQSKSSEISVTQCPSCGAEFNFQTDEHAGKCPYCATPVVAGTAHARFIHPRSLLPFLISQKEAITIYDKWIKSRWFAPSSLKKHATRDEKLTGIYLPYWTYDAQTYSPYRGQRGTIYYDRQVYTAIVNGRPVRRVRSVQRIRWQPVSGQVDLHFDDVLIGATRTLPRAITDNLQPWDLENLVPYSEHYISGFRSELYQITVDQGFLQAQNVMDHKIRQAIRRDIGGDRQRIATVNTTHKNVTFKHVLLPVWSAAFRYHGKTYRYVINGRNGVIQGERPYSLVKIVFAVIGAVLMLLALLLFMESAGMLDENTFHFDSFDPGGFYPDY